MPTQYFLPDGLEFIFHQLGIGDLPTTVNFKVGLFTGTLDDVIANGGMTQELDAAGYSRLPTTFGGPEYSNLLSFNGNLTQASNAGDWYATLVTEDFIKQGMSIYFRDVAEGDLVVTGLPDGEIGTIRVVLSGPLANGHAINELIQGGDAVAGAKSVGTPVLFSALETWPAVGGYFIVADVQEGDPTKYVYAASFADATTPILGPNDTLQVTPTWLMSS